MSILRPVTRELPTAARRSAALAELWHAGGGPDFRDQNFPDSSHDRIRGHYRLPLLHSPSGNAAALCADAL